MNKETIGIISGVIIFITIIPYVRGILRGTIQPVLTSWFLWSVIGISLLITYWGAGAKENIWAAVVGCTNPSLVAILVWVKYPSKIKPDRMGKACLTIGGASIVLWFVFRNSPDLIEYALYVAILADVCAAVPTAVSYWRNPIEDVPFAWVAFFLASGLNIFAITEHNIANYIYPIWMMTGSGFISSILIAYRIKHKIPIKEWI